MDRAERVGARSAEMILGPNPFVGFSARDFGREVVRTVKLVATQPRLTARAVMGLGRELRKVFEGESELAASARDRRFTDPSWQTDPRYRKWLQSYLALYRTAGDWLEAQALAPHSKARLSFMMELVLDAIAPSNSPLQPEAVRRFRETGGHSALDGLKALASAVRENRGLPEQVDKSKFKVGGNIANTEGAVILRTELIELIQYRPRAEQARAVPVQMVPPQINKYYIFDLSPEKSVIKALLEAGFEVFCISWFNPTAAQRDWGLAEYAAAIDVAVSAICNLRQVGKVNLAGACAGGLTLSSYAAARAAAGDTRINTMTLMVNVLDMALNSETTLGLFVTPRAIEAVKRRSRRQGVLDGKDMASAFAWLRPNDLIWNYWVNNVLLGKAPPAFDVLYWNNDSTRLPARLHNEFMDMYGSNPLVHPGVLRLHGMPIDLKRVKCDKYLLAGTTDHITPWQACYRSTQLFGGKSTFVLSNSGHIQSIMNPPGNKKAEFWAGGTLGPDPAAWRESAEHRTGSWWPHWHAWLGERSGDLRPAAEQLGGPDYAPLAEAPGHYVFD